jgi:Mg-chelatase subunit ChlD
VDFRLSNPHWLYAGIILLPIVLLGLRWFSAFGSLRRWSAVVLRVFLFGMVLLLLAGASAVTRTDRFAVIVVVDISGSIERPVSALKGLEGLTFTTPEEAERWRTRPGLDLVKRFVAQATANRGPDDLVGVVAFAGRAAVVLSPTRGGVATDGWEGVPLGEGSNLEAAIRLARGLLPPDAAGRIVIASDGVQTTGDAVAAARQTSGVGLATDGPDNGKTARRADRGVIPISVLPIEYEITREVFVEAVDAPPRAAAGSTVPIRVTLTATASATGTLRLLDDTTTVDLSPGAEGDGKRVTLSAGQNVIPLEVPLREGRVHRFKAIFEPDPEQPSGGGSGGGGFAGDTLTRNNTGEGFTITPGRGSVLLLDGVADAGGTSSPLASTLREGGFLVDVRWGDQLPADLLTLGGYDLVILENVPADAVETDRQLLLASYVRDLGGGLLMVGGPQSFGAGGWRGSPIEPLLPVNLELPDKLVTPELAIMFVLDNSGSMNMRVMGSMRSQQEIANEAAAMAIRSLDRRDLVGVNTFNESYDVLIPLGPNADSEGSAELVRRIGSGGGTQAGPAMREAAEQLGKIDAKHKHMIVMSDGKSIDYAELPGLAARLAQDGIVVSTISVGDRGDPETMRQMAEKGGGQAYNVINPEVLPKIFMKVVRVVRSPMIREVPFEPRLAQVGSPLLAGVGPLGELGGLSLTQARPDPTITTPLVSDQNEPVLAHWQAELGRVAAFTSDAGVWARSWVRRTSYRTFWLQASRLLARADSGSGTIDARVTSADGRLTVRVEAYANAADGGRIPRDGLEVPVTLYSPTGNTRSLRLSQVGPGLYEGSIAAEEAGTYITLVKPRDPAAPGDGRLAPVVSGASSQGGLEYRQLRSNADLLSQLASETGGRVLSLADPAGADLFDRGGVRPLEVLTPVWREMLVWTLILLLLDIATRRIAWDRWVSREFGEGLGQRAAAAVAERGTRAAATLDALRKGGDADTATPLGYEPPVLSDRDATTLAKAARDQRRARAHAGDAPPTAAAQPEAPPAQPESSLLAAKRRAAERFKD